jgi:hypothetical protein
MTLANMLTVVPLGNMSPSAHVFPTDHTYVVGNTATEPIVSPGPVIVTYLVSDFHHFTGGVPSDYTDYQVYFSPCAQLLFYFAHVSTLSGPLATAAASLGGCYSYSTGGETITACAGSVSLSLGAGDPIGTGGIDFGAQDTRLTPIAFANPSRFQSNPSGLDVFHTACPYDYFSDPAKTQLYGKLGNWQGTVQRTAPPICGTIAVDTAATAAGRWFFPSQPSTPEDPHLALTYDNVDPTVGNFSVGTTLTNVATNVYAFTPTNAGFVDRKFEQVTADGNVYCYDGFSNLPNAIFILALMTSTQLRIEKQTAASCGAGPWSFTGAQVDYMR